MNERMPIPALSRSGTDRDALSRDLPEVCEALLEQGSTRIIVADARGRVAAHAQGSSADLAINGLTPTLTAVTQAVHSGHAQLATLTGAQYAQARAALEAAGQPAGELVYLGCDPQDSAQAASLGTPPGPAWLAWLVEDCAVACEHWAGATGLPSAVVLPGATGLPGAQALRAIGAQLDSTDTGVATAAVGLAAWHARTRFCERCGSPLETSQAGWSRHCPHCGATIFPRTDPAVITAATTPAMPGEPLSDRLLLVHGARWEETRMSVVAGFVEAGESAEATVRRELLEEASVRAVDVRPVATQPWPFPRSLMLGYRATLDPAAQPVPDGQEVTRARLLSRQELVGAVESGEITLPGPTSIAYLLIAQWLREDPRYATLMPAPVQERGSARA